MIKYKLTSTGVFDREINASIPLDQGNRHWREFQAWLAEGNTPEPEFTPEQLLEMEKKKKLDTLAAQFDAEVKAPVVVEVDSDTFSVDGKQDSAGRLQAAIEMAEFLGETTVPVVDYYNRVHEVDIQTAKAINAQQALYFRGAYMRRAKARDKVLAGA